MFAVAFALAEADELGKVFFVQGIGLAEVAPRIQLVIPDLVCRSSFLEEEHHGFHARPGEGAAGQVQHGVQVAAFQQLPADGHGGVVGIAQKGVLDDHARPAAGLEDLDEML